jgi:hypothetical protein
LAANTTGSQNTAVGALVMPYTTSGNNNTAFGYNIMYGRSGYSGSGNTAVGTGIMYNNSGSWNSVVGAGALSNNTVGSYNTAVGGDALAFNSTGTNNTAVGERSGRNNLSGFGNAALGSNSGSFNSSGNYNTFIGTWTAPTLNTGSNNVFLGYGAGAGVYNSSSKLYIEAAGYANPLIGGDFSSSGRYVTINGNLGIGTTTIGTPSTPVIATAGVVRLHVTGGETILDQEAWTNIPFAPGWGACTYSWNSTPKYFKDSVGVVHLKGCIKRTTDYTGMTLAFYLPVGHGSQANAGFLGPLPRRSGDGFSYPSTGSNCWIYFDGGTSTNFWMYSDTTWLAAGPNSGCDFNGVTWRGE